MWKRKRTLRRIKDLEFEAISDKELVCMLRHTDFGRLFSKLLLFEIGSRNEQAAETVLWFEYRKLFYMGSHVHTVVVILK
jgi:hypothetical protein